MKRWQFLLLPLLLAACGAEPAAFMIDGPDVSITVERVKPYFWSKGWNLDIVVRRFPDCQRRYPMSPAGKTVRVEVYSPEAGIYILRQGRHWYVTDLKTCAFQTYQTPPPEPGDLLGSFQEKAGTFAFVQATGAAPRGATAEEE